MRPDPLTRRDELASLLSLCGTLTGVCVGIVAFIHGIVGSATTIVDDVLAACAASYLLCIYLITWALRTSESARLLYLLRTIEVLFLATLTVMTAAGFVMVYTIW